MDVDPGLDELAKKMRDQLEELEKEKSEAQAQNEDTTFIDMQIEELRIFMKELEDGLDEALGGKGTKRNRAEAEKKGTATAAKTLVSKLGKTFKEWLDNIKDM